MTDLLVTATDTGVGKTVVSRGLTRLAARGRGVCPVKLVETGIDPRAPSAETDGDLLARAAHFEHRLDLVAPFRFALPASPLQAARAEGRVVHFHALDHALLRARSLGRPLLVEGAGGLLVPIGPEGTFGDYARHAKLDLVVVARDALGTVNHTLLTVEAALHRGLRVTAIVLNAVGRQPHPLRHREQLAALLPTVPVLGPLPWLPDADDDRLADALAVAITDCGLPADYFWPGVQS